MTGGRGPAALSLKTNNVSVGREIYPRLTWSFDVMLNVGLHDASSWARGRLPLRGAIREVYFRNGMKVFTDLPFS